MVGVEQELADPIAERGPSRLTEGAVREGRGGERGGEPTELGRLPRSLAPFEDDELPAPHGGHPRVMIELVAPFLIPSRIHWFTCTITLSKFSFAARTR